MKHTTAANGGDRCGNDRLEKTGKSNITQLPAPHRLRPGLFAYRAPRTPGEICRAIRDALNREATLREQAGMPDHWLRETADWVGRGCLP